MNIPTKMQPRKTARTQEQKKDPRDLQMLNMIKENPRYDFFLAVLLLVDLAGASSAASTLGEPSGGETAPIGVFS